MPVHERFSYFEEALDSALMQSIKCKVIVVDSGSSHYKFIDSINRRKLPLNHLEYIRYESNCGMFGNWNRASSHSETLYTYILGDDDILSQNFVKHFIQVVNTHQEIDVYISRPILFSDKYVKNYRWLYSNGIKLLSQLKTSAALYGLNLPTISTVYKTSLLANFPFVENPFASMDWLMLYSLPGKYTVYTDSRITVAYRKHNTASTFNTQNYLLFTLSHSYIFSLLQYNLLSNKNYVPALSALLRKYLLLVSLFLRDPSFLPSYMIEQDNFLSAYISSFKFFLNFLRSRFAFVFIFFCKVGSFVFYRLIEFLTRYTSSVILFNDPSEVPDVIHYIKTKVFKP